MADTPNFSADTMPTFQQLIDYFVESLFEPSKLKQLQTASRNAWAIGEAEGRAADRKAFGDMRVDASTIFEKLERSKNEWLGPALSWLIGEILGIEVPPAAISGRRDALGKTGVGRQVGDALFNALRGDEHELQPGTEGARRLMAMASHITLHGWFSGILLEKVEKFFSLTGEIENIARLGEELVEAAGIGRIARVALRPIAQTVMAMPLQWELNKELRPTLLAAPSVIRQWYRGAWQWEDVHEELARHGYSEARISALLNEHNKFLPVADVYLLESTGAWKHDEAIKHLQEQGYDIEAVNRELRVEGQRRIKTLYTAESDALITAYADRRISKEQFDVALTNAVTYAPERALVTELADLRLALNVRHLSSVQARECVKAGILSVLDYRNALHREAYTDDAVTALELLLRKELDDKKTVDEHRRELAAEKAAAAAARAKAAAEKKAEIDAARALKQQGAIATLEDAYIRGLIPIERLADVLGAEFPADTVQIYLADVEAKRQVYMTNQQRAADAAKRAANKGLSVAQLEQALIDGILTVDEIRPQLAAQGLADADVAVVLHLMQDAAAAKRQADKLRAEAARRAATRQISLAQAEALVKGGHWTIAQFNAFLAALGYDAAGIAALDGLVNDALAKQQAAALIAQRGTPGDPLKGLTLAQQKRGVVLGTLSIEDFQQYLVSQRYSAAAVAVLMADAQDAANTAAAARARRSSAAPASDGRGLPLSTLTRAAQLGLLTPAAYLAALQARGFSDEDAALELDLLSTEIANAKQPTPAAGSAEATLAGAGPTPGDAAQLRHVQVDGELAAKGLSLATVEKSVKAGDTTIDQYTNWLEANGYGHGDAEILTALLVAELENPAVATP